MKKLIPYLLFAGVIGSVATIFFLDTLDMTKAAYQLPRLLIYLVFLLLALMLIERFMLFRKATAPEETDTPDGGLEAAVTQPASETNWPRVAIFVSLLLVYVFTIQPLGYFIATPLFLLAILGYLRSTKPQWIVLISIGFTVFVYLLFVLFLNLPVPMGILA